MAPSSTPKTVSDTWTIVNMSQFTVPNPVHDRKHVILQFIFKGAAMFKSYFWEPHFFLQ